MGVVLEGGSSHPAFGALLEGGRRVIDPRRLSPVDRSYIADRGSRTTPSYTDGVTWRVLVHPVAISAEQIGRLRAIHDGNVRPVQPLARRDLVQPR